MHKVKLCRGAMVLIFYFIYLLNYPVLSDELNCAPLKNCLFENKSVSPPLEAWNVFGIKKCEYKAELNSSKTHCPTFFNCKTPNNQFETCLLAQSCEHLALLLKMKITAVLKVRRPFPQHSCISTKEDEIDICCLRLTNSLKDEDKYGVSKLLYQKSKQRRKRYSDNYPWFYQDRGRGGHFFDAMRGNQFIQFGQNSEEDNSKIENNLSGPSDYNGFTGNFAESLFSQQNNFLNKFKTNQNDFTKGLKTSLNQQSKWLQSSIQNTTKNISDKQLNTANQITNLWNWAPKQKYNLTEETSDSAKEICMTPDNVEGTCKQASQCLTFVKVLREVNKSDSTQTEYLKKFKCGGTNNSSPSVCCPENFIVLPDTDTRIDQPKERAQESTTNPFDSYSDICGRQIIGDKIIGGTTTDLAEFPWTALLQYSTSTGLTYGCGGTIISNRYVLTAAHCVNLNILRQAGLENLQRVILGEFDTRNETDCIYTPYGTDCAESPQNFGVERIIEHEQFRPNSTPHDLALIRLDRNISFSSYIRPICLATSRSLNLNGNEVFTLTGWGRTETGQSSPVKRKTRLPFVRKENCSQLGPLVDGQMCLGSGKGTDSCKGDSGGPVMHTVSTSDDIVTILVGIISFGFGRCGTTTSVSTNVTHYMDWIVKNMS